MAGKKRTTTAKRIIKSNALRRGLLGGSPFWRTVYGALTLRKVWSRVSKKGDAPIAFREKIGEGEAWTMVHVPEESKRGRGEGRKFLIGPKRKAPRAPRWVPPALAVAGRRILEAPDPDRINKILGANVVAKVPPSRRERRRLRRLERKQQRAASREEKRSTQQAAKTALREERAARKQSEVDESLARVERKNAERAAKKARRAEKKAKREVRRTARARRAERKLRKATRRAERKARRATSKTERKARRLARRAERSVRETADLVPDP